MTISADAMPNPKVWPACSTCDMAYVLRYCYSLTSGMSWVWQRDCKHKTARPVVVEADKAETAGVPFS